MDERLQKELRLSQNSPWGALEIYTSGQKRIWRHLYDRGLNESNVYMRRTSPKAYENLNKVYEANIMLKISYSSGYLYIMLSDQSSLLTACRRIAVMDDEVLKQYRRA